MVLSISASHEGWDPTFRRGVISRAQCHRVPLSTTAAGISYRCGAVSLGHRHVEFFGPLNKASIGPASPPTNLLLPVHYLHPCLHQH